MACLASQVMSRSGSTAAVSPSSASGNRPASQASSVQGSIAPDQVGKSGLCSSPSPNHSVVMPPETASAARRSTPARVDAKGEMPSRTLSTVGSPAMAADQPPADGTPGFGLWLFPAYPADTLADLVVAAEGAGLDELWLGDEGPARDPLVTLAAAAHRTERIRLGVADHQPLPPASGFDRVGLRHPGRAGARAGDPRVGRRRSSWPSARSASSVSNHSVA